MYSGNVVALVTPVDAAGAVREADVATLVESVRGHVTGLVPALSTGEGTRLTRRQWHDVVSATVRCAQGLPVLAGIHTSTLAAVVERASAAADRGADAIVVAPPAAASQEEMYRYFAAVHDAVCLPVVVYHEPASSGTRIDLATLLRILALPDVVAVKESSGTAEFTRALTAEATGAAVFAGWETLLAQTPGVDGLIGALANLEPALCTAMLRDPTPATQHRIDVACARYGLLTEQWYRHVKAELHARGVIATAHPVDGEGVPHARAH